LVVPPSKKTSIPHTSSQRLIGVGVQALKASSEAVLKASLKAMLKAILKALLKAVGKR